MLIPDNIHPDNTIYYNGALVLQILQQNKRMNISDLFIQIQQIREVSFSILLLCLDWLYLINAAVVTDKGEVKICI